MTNPDNSSTAQNQPINSSAISPDISTLAALFDWRVKQTPGKEAYRDYDYLASQWVSFSWQDTADQVMRITGAMANLNLADQARIAILLPNGFQAVCADQASLRLGYVPVPMHSLDNPASIAYILNDSEASLLLIDTDTQWAAIKAAEPSFPALRMVVILKRELPAAENAGQVPVMTLTEWLAANSTTPSASDSAALRASAEDLAGLVYTSGTTGKPKGVMLTHRNVLSNVLAVRQRVSPVESDVFLSFLPLSHTFERTAGYYLPIAAGSCVAYARSAKQLPEDLKTVRPTILISVPRIYERVYAAIDAGLSKSNFNRQLFNATVAIGWRRFCRIQGQPAGDALQQLLDSIAWPLLSTLVAHKLQSQFGGRLRVAVSGGAPLSHLIAQCFLGLGIPLVQGYGMTETSPIVAANTPEDNDPNTVGRTLSGVDIRIGENNELLVRGPNVMRGYWKRDEDTNKVLVDGWLHTGDQAAIENGRLRIIGRVKEIIVTSTGEKISPVDLELNILNDSSFEQAYAFGDNRQFISCVLVLSKKYWATLAASLGFDPADINNLQSEAVRKAVLERVRHLTQSFPYYAQPRAVILSLEPWTVENSLLTPTLKLKRKNIDAHFAEQIERAYNGS